MGLDTSKLKTSLDSAKKNVKSFSATAISKFGGVAKIASGALVAGFIASAKAALQYGKELSNLANLSGATFDEFQRLTLGARSVGIENQKLADIFKDVNDKLGDFAQTGGGPMADFFEFIGPAIGVTIKDFQKLSGPEALQFYYDSLERVNLSQQDMVFFMEAVASDASALIPLLKNGGKAWEEYAKEMEDAGLMLGEEMVEKLKNAEMRLAVLNDKTKIFTVEMLDAYRLFGAGLGQTFKEMENMIRGADGVLVGAFTLNQEMYSDGWDQIFKTFKNGWQNIKDAVNEESIFKPIIEEIADMPAVSQEVVDQLKAMGIEAVATLSVEQIKALKKVKDLRIKTEQDIAKVNEKIAKEQSKRAEKEMTAQELYAAAIQERVQKQAELAQLESAHAEDAASQALIAKAVADKKLEVEQALTKESEKQVKFGDDQVNKEEEALDKKKEGLRLQILLAEAAGDTAKARDLQQQLADMEQINDIVANTTLNEEEAADIVKRKNEQLKESKELQTQLEAAQADGNQNQIHSLQQEIERRDEIKALVDSTNLSEKEAGAIVDAKNAKIQKQKDLQRQVLEAEADGNFELAAQLQKRIDKEQEALDLMKEFNMTIEDATALAEKLAAVNAGPDLNQSGFTTPREQKEFDRQQQERQKQQDRIDEQELRDERERGRNIPNVSDKRRDNGTIAERMATAKEERERKAANRAINREGDLGERKKMIAAEDERRANVAKENAENFGGGESKKPMSNLERQKAKNEALKERRAAEEKAKVGGPPLGPDGKPMDANGNHIGPDGKMVGPNGEPLGPGGGGGGGGPNAPGGGGGPDAPGGGGGPNAPGGGGGGGPKEPKKPENPVVAGLGPKLDDIKSELVKIEKHLQC